MSTPTSGLSDQALYSILQRRNSSLLHQLASQYRQTEGHSLATHHVSGEDVGTETPFFFLTLSTLWSEGVLWCIQDMEEHGESLWDLRHPRGADAMMFLAGHVPVSDHQSALRQRFCDAIYPKVLELSRQYTSVYTVQSDPLAPIRSAANNAIEGERLELFDALLEHYTQEQLEAEYDQWMEACSNMRFPLGRSSVDPSPQFRECIQRHRARLEREVLSQALVNTETQEPKLRSRL